VFGPFRGLAVVVLILLTISVTACSDFAEPTVQPVQASNPAATYHLDFNEIKRDRQRLEQQLEDYNHHLERIWKLVKNQ